MRHYGVWAIVWSHSMADPAPGTVSYLYMGGPLASQSSQSVNSQSLASGTPQYLAPEMGVRANPSANQVQPYPTVPTIQSSGPFEYPIATAAEPVALPALAHQPAYQTPVPQQPVPSPGYNLLNLVQPLPPPTAPPSDPYSVLTQRGSDPGTTTSTTEMSTIPPPESSIMTKASSSTFKSTDVGISQRTSTSSIATRPTAGTTEFPNSTSLVAESILLSPSGQDVVDGNATASSGPIKNSDDARTSALNALAALFEEGMEDAVYYGDFDDSENLARWGLPRYYEIQVQEELEARLKRIADQQSVPSGYAGVLPTVYFDEPATVPQQATSQSSTRAHRYAPVNVTDEEILAQPKLPPSPYRTWPKEVVMYCYPFTIDEVLDKCLYGAEAMRATGIYIPMTTELQTEREQGYYDAILSLRKTYRKNGERYKIYGVAYDNPNWSLITQIIMNHPIFDGVMVEWIGRNACIWNINKPTMGQLETILEKAGPLFYFFRMQDCQEDLMYQSPVGSAFVNPNPEISTDENDVVPGQFPKFLTPVFPCFQGQEGPCYNAFRFHTEAACSSRQKYAFSPYEPMGNLMMHYVNETCHGLPSHDLYSVV